MHVSVEGFDDKEESQILRDFTGYCAEYLIGRKYTSDITIRVVRDFGLMAEKRWADCQVVDPLSEFPQRFVIRLLGSGINRVQTMRLHAHEMIHVKQFFSGELQFLENERVMWQGENRRLSSFKDWAEPWELEARGYEKALVELFCRDRDYHSANWFVQMP